MKKLIIFLAMYCFASLVVGQNAKDHPHKDSFDMYHKVQELGVINEQWYPGRLIKATRVGEYYWLAESLDSPHRTQGSGNNWQEILEDEKPIAFAVVEDYFTNNNLDKSVLSKFENGEFEKFFGRYYNQYSVYGNWIGHSQFRRPITWSTLFADPNDRSIVYPSGKMDADPYMWKTPLLGAVQQLFGMTAFSKDNTTGRLTGKDVRIDLAAEKNANPLAQDVEIVGGGGITFSDWHSAATGRYLFNLMPAGQAFENGKGLENLFKDATFAITNKDAEMILRLGDEISYEKAGMIGAPEIPYPTPQITPFHWISNADQWSTVRMCRRLSPVELGYELFYNEALQKIVKINVNADGSYAKNPTSGYRLLEDGYLRGFYTQYFIYETETNPGYTVEDIIRFAKCVNDPLLPEPDCDCSRTYLRENMVINTDVAYSHTVFRGVEFEIIAPSNNPELVKIGLFDLRNNTFERIDIEGGRVGDTYQCVIETTARGKKTIQAYVEKEVDGTIKPVAIGRLLSDQKFSHVVDQLHVNYKTSTTYSLDALSNEDTALTGHVTPFFTVKDNPLDAFTYAVEQDVETFTIQVPYNTSTGELSIGLYTYYGDYLCDIDIAANPISGGKVMEFTCKIPYEDVDGWYLYPDEDYIAIPYYKNEPERKLSKQSQLLSMVDRIPIHVKPNYGFRQALAQQAVLEETELIVRVAPNPVDDVFTIDGNFDTVDEVQIYSITGGLIKTVKNSKTVNVANIPQGVYQVLIITDKGQVSTRIIKK